MTRLLRPRQINSPHMVYTEAQTLDEALEIIQAQKSRAIEKSRRELTRRQKAAETNATKALRQANTPVTLSDRIIPAKALSAIAKSRPPTPPDPGPWSRERVIAAYNNGRGDFQPRDLAKLARVKIHVVEKWLGFVDLTQCHLHR